MGDILQFDRKEQSKAGEMLADMLAVNIITSSLIDIAQEISAVITFHQNCKNEGMEVLDKKTFEQLPNDEYYKNRLCLLAYLCRLHGKNLQNYSRVIEQALGNITEADRAKAISMGDETFREYTEAHTTIIERHNDFYLSFLELLRHEETENGAEPEGEENKTE